MTSKGNSMNLVGKYFLQDHGDSYNTGRIVGEFYDYGMFFAQMDNMENESLPAPMVVYAHDELLDFLPDGRRVWGLFKTRKMLDLFAYNLDKAHDEVTGKVIQLQQVKPHVR